MYELLASEQPTLLEVPSREGRNSPRIDINMPLAFQLVKGKLIDEAIYEGDIIDIGYGGMHITSHKEVTLYSEIKFPFSISIAANTQNDVYAKIIKLNLIDDLYHYHLEFSSISQEAEVAIKRYINRIIEGT